MEKHIGKFIGIGVLALVAVGIMLNMKIVKELEQSVDNVSAEKPVVQVQQKNQVKVHRVSLSDLSVEESPVAAQTVSQDAPHVRKENPGKARGPVVSDGSVILVN